MVPQNGSRPEFEAGQVAVLEMGSYEDSYVAFASAPEDGEFGPQVPRIHVPDCAALLDLIRGL